MRRTQLAAVGIVLLLGLSGCSSSPKEELIESTDAKCAEIAERFSGDLAFGNSDDLETLRNRISLLEDLRAQVRGMEPPESGKADLDGWLDTIDEVIQYMTELETAYENAVPGSDAALHLHAAAVDSAIESVGPAAARFGFANCSNVDDWKIASE